MTLDRGQTCKYILIFGKYILSYILTEKVILYPAYILKNSWIYIIYPISFDYGGNFKTNESVQFVNTYYCIHLTFTDVQIKQVNRMALPVEV